MCVPRNKRSGLSLRTNKQRKLFQVRVPLHFSTLNTFQPPGAFLNMFCVEILFTYCREKYFRIFFCILFTYCREKICVCGRYHLHKIGSQYWLAWWHCVIGGGIRLIKGVSWWRSPMFCSQLIVITVRNAFRYLQFDTKRKI